MRFLLDMGISPRVVEMLRSLGHEAIRCSDVGLSRATDSSILSHAQAHDLILISTDLGFADLVINCREPCPGLVLLRLDNPTAELMCARLQIVLSALPEEDIIGSVAVVQRNKVRIRRL